MRIACTYDIDVHLFFILFMKNNKKNPINKIGYKLAVWCLQLLQLRSNPKLCWGSLVTTIVALLVTHADEGRGSKAFICVCLCVCPHDRTKTAETTITKLATGIAHHESWLYPFNIRSKDQRSKSQGHSVQKNTFQAIEWPSWVCTLSSGQRLVM